MDPNDKLQSESRPTRPRSNWLDYPFLRNQNFWIAVAVVLILVALLSGGG